MTFFRTHLARCPVIAILRGLTPAAAGTAAEQLWISEVDLVEVTVQDAAGFDALKHIAAIGAESKRLVGAGSVTSLDDFDRTISCGASFVVSPGLDLNLVDHAQALHVPYLPGVATPSELQLASTRGVADLKLFPPVNWADLNTGTTVTQENPTLRDGPVARLSELLPSA